jgi:hypothetical protein
LFDLQSLRSEEHPMKVSIYGVKRLLVVVGTAIALAAGMLAIALPVSTASGSTTVVKVPFVLSPSAQTDIAACIGEHVTVTSGVFNVVRRITPTQFVFHRNVIDGSATGVVTGTVYQATGHLQVISIAPPSASEVFTFDLTLRLVNAAGVGFRAHALEHVTITPDGDLTSSVDNFEIRCGA